MVRSWKHHMFGIIYSILLAAFTVYALLDVFVISHRYVAVVQAETSAPTGDIPEDVLGVTADDEAGDFPGNMSNQPVQEIKVTDAEYADGNITINLSTHRAYDTDIYVADVKLSSPDYLKTALADNTYGRNVKEATSVIAEESHAILAINGDFYGARQNGYVIRNGVLYREQAARGSEALVIYADGSFEIVEEGEVSAQELLDAGAKQVLSFGPGLMEDGAITVSERDEVGRAMRSNPRTAIGIIDDLHYVFVVTDGRTRESRGLSLYQLAQFMEELGVQTAYNLDGGGSSTMYFNGRVINRPTTNGRTIEERSVSDIVFIGY